MKTAILFDIDGTLLHAKGVGRPAFDRAFRAAYNQPYPYIEQLNFVGATDSGVLRAMTQACNILNTAAHEEHFFFELSKEIDTALAATPPHVYPGVATFLERLCGRGVQLGLVTGNIRATAWSKLRHAKLDHFFSFGAYGDEHDNRNEITRFARTRLAADIRPVALIGDTPLDIQAATTNGLCAIAVATGWIEADALRAAGADVVFNDFSDCSACIDWLTSRGFC